MQDGKDSEIRLALDRLRRMRTQIKKDNRLPSLLVRPFVLYRFRQTERIMEETLSAPEAGRALTYTVQFSQKAGQSSRSVTTDAELPPHVAEKLFAGVEDQDNASRYEALKALTAQSKEALQHGDAVAAARLASELLVRNTDRASWNYGNVVHEANQILGLAAMLQGDTPAAGKYLLAAGRTPGSPQLNSFGPTMTLAQALLRQGEQELVLAYLDDVARFWASRSVSGKSPVDFVLNGILVAKNAKSIKGWKSAIQQGGVPKLNRIVE